MRHVAIWAYNPGSQSARLLADALDVNIIRHRNSRFRWRSRWTVINWGAGNLGGNDFLGKVINEPGAVRIARCKTHTFSILLDQDVSIPEFTTSPQIALGWLRTGDVCSRATTTGHEGIGLCVHPRGTETLPTVPLYTKYVKKSAEYRVHVCMGDAIHIQKKVRKRGSTGDVRIRNTANGFVFTSRDLDTPEAVVAEAKAAVTALGLDFGAVDVVWNEHYRRAYVLEVNTAPGIEGITVDKYAAKLKEYIESEQAREVQRVTPLRGLRLDGRNRG